MAYMTRSPSHGAGSSGSPGIVASPTTEELIIMAMEQIAVTALTKPYVVTIEAMIGINISAAERDAAFTALLAKHAVL